LQRLKSFFAGILLAVTVFIICNCAGYLAFTLFNTGLGPAMPPVAQTAAVPPTSVSVATFVTPNAEVDAAGPLPTPVPLLPTVTATAPGAAGVAPTTKPPVPSYTPSPPAVKATVATRSRTSSSEQLQVLSHKSYVDSLGWYHIVGEVQNNSDMPMEFVEVVAKLYDQSGEVIGTKLTFTAPDVIFPGGKAPFDIIALRRSQWEKIQNYSLYAKGDVSELLLEQNLVLLNQNSYIQNDYLYVAGQVQNTGQKPALVKLIITLYDANLNVVNTNWSYADAGVLAANETSAFEVRIAHPDDPNNYHFRIQIEEESITE